MWCSNEQLRKYESVKHLFPTLEPGHHIARGYADLGYEEFYLIPGGKIISLFTGKVAELKAEHIQFFFVIPTVDEMVELLSQKGFDVTGFKYIEGRSWELVLRSVDTDIERRFMAGTIEEVVLAGVMELLGRA